MYEKYHCIQDMLVPLNTLAESLEYFHKEFQVQFTACVAVRVLSVLLLTEVILHNLKFLLLYFE